MKEMEKQNFENYRQLNILSGYEHMPWALRLLLELSTSDRTKSPNLNLRVIHYKKTVVLRFFVLQMIYHIRNAKYSSPFTMNISDIFDNRHDDLAYSFRLFNRLGVTQALSTVRTRQKVSAEDRDLQNKIDEMSSAAWVYLYDNFNKTHSTYSVVLGDTQTHTVELINRCALALPKHKPCPDERCTKNCVDSCLWNNDRNPESVIFNEIDVNENEQSALDKFERERILVSLRETIAVFTYLKRFYGMETMKQETLLTFPSKFLFGKETI